jgi:hypothetical protein
MQFEKSLKLILKQNFDILVGLDMKNIETIFLMKLKK